MTHTTVIAMYLAPALVLALAFHSVRRANALFALLMLPGTFIHELLHCAAGVLTFARPHSITLWPERLPDGRYRLGAAYFLNVRWWNAAFVGLAPLAAFPLAAGVAALRVDSAGSLGASDIVLWILLAQLLDAAWPSRADWQLSLGSWPLAVLAALSMWCVYAYC